MSSKDEKTRASFNYEEFLVNRTVDELRKFATEARIKLPTQMKKQQLLDYLLQRIPGELTEVRKRLNESELLLCEIVASAGGSCP